MLHLRSVKSLIWGANIHITVEKRTAESFSPLLWKITTNGCGYKFDGANLSFSKCLCYLEVYIEIRSIVTLSELTDLDKIMVN